MPVPHRSINFADLLDPRFQKIFFEAYDELPDMLPALFTFDQTNGRDSMKWSEVGTLGNWAQFEGTVIYDSQSQGFDVTSTPVEFASGIQVERKLFDDDQFNIMDQKPRALAGSAHRSRQEDGARMLNNAFSIDSLFYVNSEGVPLCSNSHITTSGASTTTGFDNLGTASLTATAVAAARISMVDFRGDRAERISVTPTELWYPPNLYEQAFEIMGASGKVDTDLNNPNVHKGQYTGHEWNYLTDTNNWFLADDRLRKEHVHWIDRIPMEFAMAEELDNIIAKWRGYMRHSTAHTNWRWVFGSQVS